MDMVEIMNRLDKFKLNGRSKLFSPWWLRFWFLDVGEMNLCYTFARPDIDLKSSVELEENSPDSSQ